MFLIYGPSRTSEGKVTPVRVRGRSCWGHFKEGKFTYAKGCYPATELSQVAQAEAVCKTAIHGHGVSWLALNFWRHIVERTYLPGQIFRLGRLNPLTAL